MIGYYIKAVINFSDNFEELEKYYYILYINISGKYLKYWKIIENI